MSVARVQKKYFPELSLFESDHSRRDALRSAIRQLFRSPRFWLFGLGYVIVFSMSILMIVWLVRRWSGFSVPAPALGGIAGGLAGGTFVAAMRAGFRNPIRRYLRERLVEQGVPICVKCSYDLRGLQEARCPECGAAFDERLLHGRNADVS